MCLRERERDTQDFIYKMHLPVMSTKKCILAIRKSVVAFWPSDLSQMPLCPFIWTTATLSESIILSHYKQ